jgi:hypothetical protein
MQNFKQIMFSGAAAAAIGLSPAIGAEYHLGNFQFPQPSWSQPASPGPSAPVTIPKWTPTPPPPLWIRPPPAPLPPPKNAPPSIVVVPTPSQRGDGGVPKPGVTIQGQKGNITGQVGVTPDEVHGTITINPQPEPAQRTEPRVSPDNPRKL